MAKDLFATALQKFPKEQQKAILATIKAAEQLFPKSTRAIAWGMPTLKIGEENLCHVFGFKEHNSLFPASGGVASLLKKDLTKYKISKGTIQFDSEKPFPKPLLKKVLLARLNQINSSYPRKNGEFLEFYKNGGIKIKGKYKANKMNGKWEFFRIDGSIMRSGSFKDGKQSGEWITYAKNGRKVKVTKF